MTIKEISNYLNIKEINSNLKINTLNSISLAKKNELAFLDNEKYKKDIKQTKASAILIKKEFIDLLPQNVIGIICDEPYVAMAKLSKLFVKPRNILNNNKDSFKNIQIADNAFIGNDTIIGNDSIIMAGVVIGNNVQIGSNTIIYPNVSIYDDCIIGDNCFIHSNATIGADGFGFATSKKGKHYKIHHLGNVKIGNDVEIGANTTIDRAALNSTKIGSYTKLDNTIQIGHNTTIGESCKFAAHTAIAGSVTIGNYVLIGAMSGIGGHISICDYAVVSARTGIIKSITLAKQYTGFPAKEHKKWLRHEAKLSKITQG
jgi:UDP-3-O-[3-hydroxymyristoyl] glucosamine N-acyltransferase